HVEAGHRSAPLGAVGRGYFLDPVVLAVGDEQVPNGVGRHSVGLLEQCSCGRAAVAAVPGCSGRAAGDGVDVVFGHLLAALQAGGDGDLLDAVVERVGDVQVADAVYGDAPRPVQQRPGGRAAVPAGTGGTGGAAGQDVDVPGG